MEGFRHAYELPKTWGLVKERLIAFSLVILAGVPLMFATILVAFGSSIETRVLFHLNHEFGFYILLMWTAIRWLIASMTSVAVIALSTTTPCLARSTGTACYLGNPGYGHVAAGHSAVRLVPAALR